MTVFEKSTNQLDDESPDVLADMETSGQVALSTNPQVGTFDYSDLSDRDLLEHVAKNSDQLVEFARAQTQAITEFLGMFKDSPIAAMFSGDGMSMNPLQLLRRGKRD